MASHAELQPDDCPDRGRVKHGRCNATSHVALCLVVCLAAGGITSMPLQIVDAFTLRVEST
jgi:hypothetical protein